MARTIEESFFCGAAGLVLHRQHFAGVDDLDAVIGRMFAGLLVSASGPTKKRVRIVGSARECLFDAFDDDPATVVATHDIHCNSHR